jgi:hypothetical protein
MSKKAVFGIAKGPAQASSIIEALREDGFSNDDISVLFPDKRGQHDLAHEGHTKAPEGATTGAVAGGVLGGVTGWLVGIGTLAIPGLGPFIAAGPIMAALAGSAAGATAVGIAGALVGFGIPEYEAKRYEGKISRGNVLISVHCEDRNNVHAAKRVLQDAGAEDISDTGEASVPSHA